jgi:hypothetical protein
MSNNTAPIKCGFANCDSDGWDSYNLGQDLYVECTTCGRKSEGAFEIDAAGWVVRSQKVGA